MRSGRQASTETTVQAWKGRPETLVRHEDQRLRWRPFRAAVEEVERFHQLAAVGESEWTPWVTIAGLILFFATVELLIFGTVEGAARLLASAP